MQINNIPDSVLTKPAIPIPTKTVVTNDYDALYQLLLSEKFVVIESDDMRADYVGHMVCSPIKSFVTYMNIRKVHIATKRLSQHRWLLAVKE
jgi:hypothetical protein